jgi:hypothetical protein
VQRRAAGFAPDRADLVYGRGVVATLIDPAKLRHVAWSHFESDECGALNDWLQLAPQAQPVCTLVGKLVSVDDFSIRPSAWHDG